MKNKKTHGNSKYEDKYCDKLIKFFSRPSRQKFLVKKGIKELKLKDEYKIIANDLPFFSKFEIENNLYIGRLSRWNKTKNKDGSWKYPKFRQSYKKAKELQKIFLINNGLAGLYNPTAFIFTAKNITDMRDTRDLDITSGGESLKQIAKAITELRK